MRIGGESPSYEPVPLEPPSPSGGRTSADSSRKVAFGRVLHGWGSAVDRGEALIAQATRGNLGGLDSAQLIALQAGIYRYSEAVDLLAKLVDRASNAVRTVISPH
jgi:hypothetical protein